MLSSQLQNTTTDWDPDPNHERRKRRKTDSPAPESLKDNNGIHKQQQRETDVLNSWHQQLLEAANPTHSAPADYAREILVADAPKPVQDSPTRIRRSPRSLDAGQQQESPRRAQAGQTTPRKRTVKLSATGTLQASPKASSPTAKKSQAKLSSSVRLEGGKLVPSRTLHLKYGGDDSTRQDVGARIDTIISQPPKQPSKDDLSVSTSQCTHPFFLKKPRNPILTTLSSSVDSSVKGDESDRDEGSVFEAKPRPDWKDLHFSSIKIPLNSIANSSPAPWPPISVQHVGLEPRDFVAEPRLTARLLPNKQKQRRLDVNLDENVLSLFNKRICNNMISLKGPVHKPARRTMSAARLEATLESQLSQISKDNNMDFRTSAASKQMFESLATSPDQTESPGNIASLDWVTKHAPRCGSHVLQPDCVHLRSWLANLSVRNTASASNPAKTKVANHKARGRRKGPKKDDLDDFIVSSEDELNGTKATTKNAILISGPNGCGKTAAVYAVAKELDFEVFEIHPGMRRSSKDIFDKVGDMTQNHLVRPVTSLPEQEYQQMDDDSSSQLAAQHSVKVFFQPGKQKRSQISKKEKPDETMPAAKPASQPKKESLVLFEEVDVLFDEDKFFWNGVLALIEQSKRPVVLTCNDMRDVPIHDLPLHTILHFRPPSSDVVGPYLTLLAAKEGHLLQQHSISILYEFLERDLRSTITQLQFWCQIGVGSQQAGLDWLLDRQKLPKDEASGTDFQVLSQDTYRNGLELADRMGLAQCDRDRPDLTQTAQEDFEIPVATWHQSNFDLYNDLNLEDTALPQLRMKYLHLADRHADLVSLLDLADEDFGPTLSSSLRNAYVPQRPQLSGEDVIQTKVRQRGTPESNVQGVLSALEALKIEKPVFPPAIGRLAPSLEGPATNVVVDIAPYVRSIVAFDERLEKQREELDGGSQSKKSRKTRAARAALEGGSKASTRGERWFSQSMDLTRVLETFPRHEDLVAVWFNGLCEG